MEGLSSICAGLGILEEDENGNPMSYSKGEYCLDNLKDLLRFLRRDDPQTREVFKQVCKWNIVGKDLIPIIEYCQNDRNLVLNAVKILVFLTMPIETTSDDIPLQIEYLWGLKASITYSHIVPVILSLLETPLEHLECESFTEDDWKLVQLVLTLFRNILAIQEISTQQKAGGSATQFLSIRDRCLELFFQENVMDLILVLSEHVGGSFGYLRQDNLLLLETFYYIFMGQEPELIAKAHLNDSKEVENGKISVNSLKCIMEEEERKKLTRLRNLGCSPQFSGIFTRLTLDGSKSLFKGNPCSASRDALLKANKSYKGPSKRMVWDHGRVPLTKNKLLKQLYGFIDQFLSGGYNVLMQSVREDIEKEHHAVQNSDIVVFFKVAWFITSFQYHKFSASKPTTEVVNETSTNQQTGSTLFSGSLCGPLSESLNESMFLVVISRWRLAFDSLKETNDTKMLSSAGSLLKIMISMLDLVLKQSPGELMEPKTARVLLYKLFYDQTEEGMTQFLFNMIKSFDTHKQARSDLADLVETIYVIIKLMENLQTHGTLRVSKRSRRKKMKKDRTDKLVGNDITNKNEVPGTHYEPSEDTSTLGKNTVGIDSGGNENDGTIPVSEPIQLGAEMENLKGKTSEIEKHISDYIHGTDASSGDEQQVMTDEVDFKFSTLVSALGNNAIVKNLCWLLRFYKSNSTSTNQCIISILRRISEDLELSPMLYQLSLLTTFYNILEEQKSRPCKEYENIVFFLTTLVRRMLRRLKSYPLLFVEILFWKTRKECHCINSDCMLKELAGFRKEFNENQNDLVNGETGLSEGRVQRSIADALGDDEADIIVSYAELGHGDEDPNKTEKVKERSKWRFDDEAESNESTPDDGEENDSKEGQCIEKVPEGLHKRRKSVILTTELERKIKDLYEKYNNDDNCHHLIANSLERDGERISPNQLSRILKQFGFKPSKLRRISQTGSSDKFRDSEVTALSMDKLEISSAPTKPLHTRKRVRALSEDQEQRVKDLFEQFKDQKKCSLMIANALEGGVSAAQVSRKLKQLGLSVPRKKRSATSSKKLKDDDPIELSGEGAAAVSDDETLISLRRRKKKSYPSKTKDDRPKSNYQTTVGSELADVDIQDLGRNETENAAEVGTQEVDHATSDHADIAEAEAAGEHSVVAYVGKNLHDELADIEDDDAQESQKSFVPRRQLRMIIDLEDDE